MAMMSGYVREDWEYRIDELRRLFSFTAESYRDSGKPEEKADDELKKFIRELLSRRLLKEKKTGSQKNNQESENAGEEAAVVIEFDNYSDSDFIRQKKRYAFSFVGIIICRNRIICSYPKYFGDSFTLPSEVPANEFGQVIRVIEKYNREKSGQEINDISLFADKDDAGDINTLSVMLFLLEDYAANGVYENNERIIEVNGSGEILWQKTVDETYPMLVSNKPYYFDLFTQKTINNEFDYFRMLHEYVLTQCSAEVRKAGLDLFFSLPSAELSEEEESFFGDKEDILNRLDSETALTYDDRKLSVLKAMRLYFNSDRILTGDNRIQLIGTRAFNLIWEEVCAKVFGSQKGDRYRRPTIDEIQPRIDDSLIDIQLDKRPPTLAELIQHPVWKKYREGSRDIPAGQTFNPDFLRFEPDAAGNTYTFYILDAKYYCPVWTDDSVSRQPGVEDVAKQYLYYLAYRDILEQCNVTGVKNYFIMPKRKSDSKIQGFVKLDILKKLGLGVIEVRMLDPVLLYEKYLNNQHLDLAFLDC